MIFKISRKENQPNSSKYATVNTHALLLRALLSKFVKYQQANTQVILYIYNNRDKYWFYLQVVMKKTHISLCTVYLVIRHAQHCLFGVLVGTHCTFRGHSSGLGNNSYGFSMQTNGTAVINKPWLWTVNTSVWAKHISHQKKKKSNVTLESLLIL